MVVEEDGIGEVEGAKAKGTLCQRFEVRISGLNTWTKDATHASSNKHQATSSQQPAPSTKQRQASSRSLCTQLNIDALRRSEDRA